MSNAWNCSLDNVSSDHKSLKNRLNLKTVCHSKNVAISSGYRCLKIYLERETESMIILLKII